MKGQRRLLGAMVAVLLVAAGVGAQGPGMPMPPMMPPGGIAPAPAVTGVGAQATEAGAVEMVADGSAKRNPFWPVGYTPKIVRKIPPKAGTPVTPGAPGTRDTPASVAAVPERVTSWDEARKKLDVRGVSRGRGKFWASIGSRTVETGDTVSVTYEKQVYRWRITAINQDGISFQKVDVRSE